MEKIINKYINKLVSRKLCKEEDIIIGCLEVDISWNRESPKKDNLKKIFDAFSINSILYSRPAFPYDTIIQYLIKNNQDFIEPKDCETRTFLHSIPIAKAGDFDDILDKLASRKGIITTDGEIITYGNVTLEQAYITYSSICFACFVKFFVDYYYLKSQNTRDSEYNRIIKASALWYLDILKNTMGINDFIKGPINEQDKLFDSLKQTGEAIVKSDMVDSYFGNISALFDDSIYISQTGSSLDELTACIDIVPIDGSSCAGITSSSELPAHKKIYSNNKNINFILHGHPRFCVIQSMYCEEFQCRNRGKCHTKCHKERFFSDIPIVPGEVGSGPYGLDKTLPEAIEKYSKAIVYGHGIFTTGEIDFIKPYTDLISAERKAFEIFLRDNSISFIKK